jgi:hypothetical protein
MNSLTIHSVRSITIERSQSGTSAWFSFIFADKEGRETEVCSFFDPEKAPQLDLSALTKLVFTS